MLKRISRVLVVAVLVILIGIGGWLYFVPPGLLSVGSGYAAKIVCSNVFIAHRDPQEVLALDVQAPGNPLLRLMRVEVDRETQHVRAELLGSIAPSEAIYREGTGCTLVPYGATAIAQRQLRAPDMIVADGLWPQGQKVEPDESFAGVLSDAALTGPGMRGTVIVHNGRIAGEAYGSGFSKDTPLIGWSMTKTVNAAIIGRLLAEGRMQLDEKGLFPEWRNDGRAAISVADLLGMESGLAFNEDYGTVADVTRMLFLEPDMARYVASLPLEGDVGRLFKYSSGTAMLLSRIWMDHAGSEAEAIAYPRKALFEPLGMTSAVLETDAAGTYAGSSYMYATPRDWARFGLLLAHDGVWQGKRLLPEGFVAQMHEPDRSSNGRYSKMQTWLPKPDAGLPADAFLIDGHDGQKIYVIPSLDLVVLRMGLTPRAMGYDPIPLVKAVIRQIAGE
ncbi:CubicO group peptidase, beta-lactamase class C family [Rhizobium sp. NFR07]|uniref:serine hydrolase domain-containing protein n=1 Tax=Rhizobium sp. NFR07 TaxID=1566262 RepID=UPI0008EA6515|nr:serine hydrolase [Rhizobium sp. NFR07]SFB48583.1 CubicO group peptidase, beta-lactamase class C family [Rhizobium sp. NFR07]